MNGPPPAAGSRLWWWLVGAVSVWPVRGVFSLHRIFFVRDLSLFFWSRHLWLRHTIFAGHAPWWDPYVASGQSAVADALNQLLMPVTLAIRLLPSDVISFNVWAALPIPIAALGAFAFLRERVRAPAAALGALVFALGGPAVSMVNAPNLSWSVALMPWVLWACARSGRRATAVAIAFALQALSGEPVTLASTAALALAIAIPEYGVRAALRVLAGLVAGAALAAPQLVPMTVAALKSHRGTIATPDFWSLHPVSLWQVVLPHLFGDYYHAFLADLPWMGALNFGRDPFFYSLYLGPMTLLLAAAAIAGRPRRAIAWYVLASVFLFAALGGYTPVYPLARRLLPALLYFRFPVKYFVVAAFATAVLAAEGFDALLAEKKSAALRSVATCGAIVAVVGLAAACVFVFSPAAMAHVAYKLALATHVESPSAAGAFLARVAPILTARAAGLLLGAVLLTLLAIHDTRRAPLALTLVFAAACVDLAIANGALNPTADASLFAPPAWYAALAGPARVYIGGRVRGFMNTGDRDASDVWRIPPAASAVLGRMELNAELPMAPSGWSVREALSYDLPVLWSAAYDRTVQRFERANDAERDAFFRRTAVRWCVQSEARPRPWHEIANVPDWAMRVYECNPSAARAFVATVVQSAPDSSNEDWQREALFDPRLPDTIARVARMPSRSGAAGAPAPAAASIVRDAPGEVVVEAASPGDTVLVLRDTYDPSWRAEVDGVPAEIVPADLLYRAVALPPGRHTVRFVYRPRALIDGLMIAGLMALLLIGAEVGGRRLEVGGWRSEVGKTRPQPPSSSLQPRTSNLEPPTSSVQPPTSNLEPPTSNRGFTLVELLIVIAIIAILFSVALAQYRNMRAHGNEASTVQSLHAIATAQWQFAATCGNLHYATTLTALGKPAPSTGQAFLSPDLTGADTIQKSGYWIRMSTKPDDDTTTVGCNGAALADGYVVTADPLTPGTTGTKYFGVNTERTIYADQAQTFTGDMQDSGSPSHGTEVK